MIEKRIEVRHVLRGVRGELRINDLSARPAAWGSGSPVGVADLMPFVVRGWNEVELWLRRDEAMPEDERQCSIELFASGSYRREPSGDDGFLAFQLTRHIAVEAPPGALACVLRHRFMVPEVHGTRLALRARPAGVDDALRGAMVALREAVRGRDLRALHRAYALVLHDEAEATDRPFDEVEAGWLDGWATAFAASDLIIEASSDPKPTFESTGGGRVHIARTPGGAPSVVARWDQGRRALGLSPAWGWVERGWCVVR